MGSCCPPTGHWAKHGMKALLVCTVCTHKFLVGFGSIAGFDPGDLGIVDITAGGLFVVADILFINQAHYLLLIQHSIYPSS